VIVGLTVAELTLALLLAWLLFRSDFARHASLSVRLGAGDLFVLVAMGACLALFIFVLGFWQWRLRARARVRLLLAIFLSLLLSFCGFCWHDVSLGTAEQAEGAGAPAPMAQVIEQTAAVTVTLGALLVGLIAVVGVLWLERRSLNHRGQGGIVRAERQRD